MLRRISLLVFVLLAGSPSIAHAAGWHRFTSKPMHFTVRYPASWMVVPTYLPGTFRVQMGLRSGTQSMAVQFLPIHPAKTIRATANRYAGYMSRTSGDGSYRHIRWSNIRVARRQGVAGVLKPLRTEGGLAMVRGIELVQYKGRVYEIEFGLFRRTAPRSINQFPAVYREIMRSWRFL